jgi:hypothetical protein
MPTISLQAKTWYLKWNWLRLLANSSLFNIVPPQELSIEVKGSCCGGLVLNLFLLLPATVLLLKIGVQKR